MANKQKSKAIKKQKKRTIKKKFLVVLMLIIAIILVFVLLIINHSDDDLKYNKNESFVKTQKIKGIVFKDIKCTYDGKDSLISYTIVNETKKKVYLNNYDIIVKDKNKVRLTKIAAHITQTLAPKKSIKMADQVVGTDLTNAYYMELKLNTNKKGK